MNNINFFKKQETKEKKIFEIICDGSHNKNFSGLDSQTLFNENLKIMPDDWHYRTKEIFYELNSEDYRTYEWKNIDWKNAIIIFGCSCVYGIGLAEDETISYNLEKLTSRQVINMGFPSGSNEVMINNCCNMINNFDLPYAVIFGWTALDRFIYYSKNNNKNIGNWVLNNKKDNYDYDIYSNLYKYRTIKEDYLTNVNKKLKNNAMALLKNKSKYIDFSFFQQTAITIECDCFTYKQNARDMSHPGRESAKKVSGFLFKKINDASK